MTQSSGVPACQENGRIHRLTSDADSLRPITSAFPVLSFVDDGRDKESW